MTVSLRILALPLVWPSSKARARAPTRTSAAGATSRPIHSSESFLLLDTHRHHSCRLTSSLILTHTLNETTLDNACRVTQGGYPAALAYTRRNWLSGMRMVSSGWNTAGELVQS